MQRQRGETVHCPFSGILVPSPQTLSSLRAASLRLGKSPTALGSTSSQVGSPPLSANSELMWPGSGALAGGMGTSSPTLPLRGARPAGPLRPWEVWVPEGPPHG